jgi:mono/diheme cytochrome c family protein
VKLNLKVFAVFCLAAFISAPVFAQSGADTYKAKCLMCHGADGLGNTPVGKSFKIVSFKDPSVLKSPNAALETIVKNGKNKMPAFAGKLTDAQIGQVVEYIRTLQK